MAVRNLIKTVRLLFPLGFPQRLYLLREKSMMIIIIIQKVITTVVVTKIMIKIK